MVWQVLCCTPAVNKHHAGQGVDLLAMPGLFTRAGQFQLSKAANGPHSRQTAVGRFVFRHAGGGPHSSSVFTSLGKVRAIYSLPTITLQCQHTFHGNV